MKKLILFILFLLSLTIGYAEIVNITIPSQIQSFMDSRHYDPTEIDTFSMGANTNGEATYYIDGTNGSDSYNGLYPTYTSGLNGPYKTINKALGRYDGHRYGERILIRTGIYRERLESGNLVGTDDEDHYNTLAPYGDGEVIIDASCTSSVGTFSVFSGNIYKATSSITVGTAILDYNPKSCRKAVGYTAIDNGGTDNRATSMTDTTKNFVSVPWNDGVHEGIITTDFVGAIIWNITDGSWGIVTSVSTTTNDNDTLNFSGGLTGGTDNDFDNGDSYAAYIMTVDGTFIQIGTSFYLVSTSGTPSSRNFLANPDDNDNTMYAFYASGIKKLRLYGLTILASPSIGAWMAVKTVFENCRFLFCGKTASGGSDGGETFYKCFIYGGVMHNWPRGRTYGGNGGWPNAMSNGIVDSADGCIVWECGGEGTTRSLSLTNSIFVDNFSMNIYNGNIVTEVYKTIANNVVLFTGYKASDILHQFYLKDFYNGNQRTYVKMHPNGITLSQEVGGGNIIYWRIYNNLVIGHWRGIFFYIEENATTSVNNIVITSNTIIAMTDEDIPPLLYGDAYILSFSNNFLNASNILIKNNILIGANNTDTRHFIASTSGTSYSNVVCDYNLYSFPGNDRFIVNAVTKTFAQWQSTTGYDANSIQTDTPNLIGTDWTDSSLITKDMLTLAFNSPALDVGATLGSPYNVDYQSVSRPQSTGYDMGALEYVVAGTLDHYHVTATTPQTQNIGWTQTVTAKDSADNTVSSDSSTVVTITHTGSVATYTSNSYATPTSTYTLANGIVTIYLKDASAETVTITATDPNEKTGTSGSIVVDATPPEPVPGNMVGVTIIGGSFK